MEDVTDHSSNKLPLIFSLTRNELNPMTVLRTRSMISDSLGVG